MKKLLIPIIILLFSVGCSSQSNHPSPEVYIHKHNINANHHWNGHMNIIVIHHYHKLSRHEKKMLKRWYRKHYRMGHKKVKFKFIFEV